MSRIPPPLLAADSFASACPPAFLAPESPPDRLPRLHHPPRPASILSPPPPSPQPAQATRPLPCPSTPLLRRPLVFRRPPGWRESSQSLAHTCARHRSSRFLPRQLRGHSKSFHSESDDPRPAAEASSHPPSDAIPGRTGS